MTSKVQLGQKRFHIIVDAWDANPKTIVNEKAVKKFLLSVLPLLGMTTMLHPPVIVSGIPENPGLTGFLLIDFSHISIHTFVENSEVCVDIFSCKPYDYERVKNFIREFFNINDQNIRYLEVKY